MVPVYYMDGLLPRQSASPVGPPSDTKVHGILGAVGFLTAFSTFLVALRSYVRAWMLRRFGVDDYIMLLALVLSLGVLGCFVGESSHGLGRYTQDISQDDQEILRKYNFYHSLIVMVGISTVKISVGFFLLRISEQTRFKRFILGMIIFLIAFTLACAGTLIFQCVPVSAAWDLTKRGSARCFSIHTFTAIGIFNSSINIATDVIFATLPIPMFYNIQVNKRTKASLMCILSLGYLACASAIVKTVAQARVLGLKNMYRDSTFTTWNCVELNIGIVAASLPTIKPLLKTLLETTRKMTSSGRTRTRTDGYYMHKGSGIIMGSLKPSRPGGSHLDHDSESSRKYNVQVSAARASISGDSGNSDEILASPPRTIDPSGIMRTTEVYVQRDNRSTDDDTMARLGPRRNVDDRI